MSNGWAEDCLRSRGKVLVGKYAHWCIDWDFLPIDETCPEWPCICEDDLKKEREKRMSEMIERVAYALAEADGIGSYEHMARAAIGAMRGTTEEMLDAGAEQVPCELSPGSYERKVAGRIWRDMCDAALKEEK